MEGDKDVHRGHVFARAQGVPGGGDEHQGGVPGVRACTETPCARCSRTPCHRDTAGSALPIAPSLSPYTGVIDGILEDDLSAPKKQRHTAKRIFRAAEEGARVRWRLHHSQGLCSGAPSCGA